jgi:hypothetical protein
MLKQSQKLRQLRHTRSRKHRKLNREAVARAEATLAQVNAEAYADGKVSAEEQARIDQAAANLAEAKTHAEAKAAEAESAAKAHTDAQLSDHDANQSPHSLPSYVRMEPTGFVVYDEQGVKRTHNGMYAPGEYGNWVDAGYYVLRDKGMDMSLMQLPNMVLDHSFEMLKEEGPIDVTYYDYAIKDGSGGWGKIGEPRMYSYVLGDGYLSWQSDSFFGVRSAVVNSTNYLQTGFYCKPNTQYFISGFVCLGYRNPTAGTPRIVVEFWESNEEKWPPEDPIHISTTGQNFTPNTDKKFNWKRVGFAFTTPSNCDQMRIQVKSADANYVCWDAIQVVEANKPVRYDPERTLFWHMDDGSMQMGLGGHIVESGENANGRWIRFSDGTQICYYSGTKSIAINYSYGTLYQGTYTYDFPISFASIPAVSVGQSQWGTGASWGMVSDVTTSIVTLRFIDAFSRTAASMHISYIAIGRWK